MTKITIENLKNNDEYKKIVKRILVSVLIIIPYIVLFFFLEKYDIVNQGRFSSPEDVRQNLIRENDTLKLENSRLLEELNRLKAAETEETP